MNINDYYEVKGEGQPVVFIHGSFSSSAAWRHYIAALAEDYQCLSIKLPGHSSPELPEEDAARFDNDVEFVECLLNDLDKGPIKLIGHSYGAALCGEMALRGNIEIECMTLFEPVSVWALHNIGNDKLNTQMQKFLKELYANYLIAPELVCQLVINFWNNEEIFDSLPDRAKDQMSPLAAYNIQQWDWCKGVRHETRQINDMFTPTTIVSGTASHPIVQEISRFLAENMKNARQVELPRANHFLINTHTEDCLEIIDQDFRNALTRSSTNLLGLKSQSVFQA